MSPKKLVAGIVASSIALVCALAMFAAETQPQNGSWTIQPSDEPGKVRFALLQHWTGHNSNHESDWSANAFEGLDLSVKGKRDVKFVIRRDAGRFECEGYIENSEGAGVFHLFPDGKYADGMSAVGFKIDSEKQMSMAIFDVSIAFAKEMKSLNLKNLDTDKLIAFRIFGVDSKFIQAIRAEGLNTDDSDKLVAFRIHGVSPEFVRSVRTAGYQPDQDELIAMRIHGATPEYISNLKSRGMKDLTIDQLVSLRIHGID